ncbi:MAG: hypothetical protein A3F89_02915 [Deltaproteobacteria bacterium RIFCSPLOWO2_12_FULL_50_11]|nr:MAG: hypothetical protein A2053_02115 [Deltaproteobacteria bacterium GWA2_50_8]OGQ26231.1 MAG: hypothetical protein A3B79_06530 [Deltaproteobacteria bacterium RIFCSPHIGHO2_02_FULL_50_15]OGQ67540.1 MAG: hypothetical protein A3F89_02915 [Deltaproteobacteria bacterium RIFCSPLOWO2_12_FULL_50_11]
MKIDCPSCHHVFEVPEPIGRQESCPRCSSDLHSCRWCRFFDPRAYNECRETSADRVVDKERANFCDFFQWFPQQRREAGSGVVDKTSKAREALEKLFKKK